MVFKQGFQIMYWVITTRENGTHFGYAKAVKGIIRFRKRGKLSPRYIGPFRIEARVGKVEYRLELPEELNGIHPTFHVSHLRKCLADEQTHVPLDDTEVDNRLNYIEEPVAIMDTKAKQLHNKTV
ncbi:hypothetical protein E3N88_34959 [Mikania micrantha]|uniref:Tf2-1-like SH3-like domain-containing protein n=1 Tax=Mikania micrantha TaxID=192012 RepID=A0A5N6LZM0_9ASTR|nr:hypothetical protein E3N88_34959 [Mikania micrantha]